MRFRSKPDTESSNKEGTKERGDREWSTKEPNRERLRVFTLLKKDKECIG
jgi:hypothetical protein